MGNLKVVKGNKGSLLESELTDQIKELLVGRKIVLVRFMTKVEAEEMGWHNRPIVIQLNDGTIIYPSIDPEGNNGAVLFTNNSKTSIITRL